METRQTVAKSAKNAEHPVNVPRPTENNIIRNDLGTEFRKFYTFKNFDIRGVPPPRDESWTATRIWDHADRQSVQRYTIARCQKAATVMDLMKRHEAEEPHLWKVQPFWDDQKYLPKIGYRSRTLLHHWLKYNLYENLSKNNLLDHAFEEFTANPNYYNREIIVAHGAYSLPHVPTYYGQLCQSKQVTQHLEIILEHAVRHGSHQDMVDTAFNQIVNLGLKPEKDKMRRVAKNDHFRHCLHKEYSYARERKFEQLLQALTSDGQQPGHGSLWDDANLYHKIAPHLRETMKIWMKFNLTEQLRTNDLLWYDPTTYHMAKDKFYRPIKVVQTPPSQVLTPTKQATEIASHCTYMSAFLLYDDRLRTILDKHHKIDALPAPAICQQLDMQEPTIPVQTPQADADQEQQQQQQQQQQQPQRQENMVVDGDDDDDNDSVSEADTLLLDLTDGGDDASSTADSSSSDDGANSDDESASADNDNPLTNEEKAQYTYYQQRCAYRIVKELQNLMKEDHAVWRLLPAWEQHVNLDELAGLTDRDMLKLYIRFNLTEILQKNNIWRWEPNKFKEDKNLFSGPVKVNPGIFTIDYADTPTSSARTYILKEEDTMRNEFYRRQPHLKKILDILHPSHAKLEQQAFQDAQLRKLRAMLISIKTDKVLRPQAWETPGPVFRDSKVDPLIPEAIKPTVTLWTKYNVMDNMYHHEVLQTISDPAYLRDRLTFFTQQANCLKDQLSNQAEALESTYEQQQQHPLADPEIRRGIYTDILSFKDCNPTWYKELLELHPDKDYDVATVDTTPTPAMVQQISRIKQEELWHTMYADQPMAALQASYRDNFLLTKRKLVSAISAQESNDPGHWTLNPAWLDQSLYQDLSLVEKYRLLTDMSRNTLYHYIVNGVFTYDLLRYRMDPSILPDQPITCQSFYSNPAKQAQANRLSKQHRVQHVKDYCKAMQYHYTEEDEIPQSSFKPAHWKPKVNVQKIFLDPNDFKSTKKALQRIVTAIDAP